MKIVYLHFDFILVDVNFVEGVHELHEMMAGESIAHLDHVLNLVYNNYIRSIDDFTTKR